MGLEVQETIFSEKQERVIALLESPENNHVSEVFYGGAAGGGKTFLIAHWQIERRLSFKGTRGFIGRESLKNLKLTTFKTFCDVWDEYYRNNPWRVSWSLNGMTNTIHFTNGSEIILMDLGYYPSDPEYHRLGSLELTDACIDELPEIQEKCYEILMSRIRYRLEEVGGVPKCLATGNPSLNWVKNRYIKTQEGEEVTLKDHQSYVRATVYDNPDEQFKKTYITALKKLSPVDMARLLHGDWDQQHNDNPWAWALSRDKHFTNTEYKPNNTYPIDLSWDFNHDPCTVVVAQYLPHVPHFAIIAYHRASSGVESAIKQLCERIRAEYPHHYRTKMIRITGDASGTQRSPDRPSNINRYSDILSYLQTGHGSVKIEKANISHKASRDLCNDLLNQIQKGGYLFYGGRGCEVLINEIESAFPDEKESLNKAKKDLGLHGLDAWRYLNQLWFAHRLVGADFRSYQKNINAITSRL